MNSNDIDWKGEESDSVLKYRSKRNFWVWTSGNTEKTFHEFAVDAQWSERLFSYDERRHPLSLLPVSSLRFFSNPIKSFSSCFSATKDVSLRNFFSIGLFSFSHEAIWRRDILMAKSSKPFLSSSDYGYEYAIQMMRVYWTLLILSQSFINYVSHEGRVWIA